MHEPNEFGVPTHAHSHTAAHQHGGDEGERKRGSGKSGKTVHNEFLQDGRLRRKFNTLI